MSACFVASDLSYPPREGLHQQTLLLVKGLVDGGQDLAFFTFCRDSKLLDHELMRKELGIVLAAPPIMYSGSTLSLGVRLILRLPVGRRSGVRLLRRSIRDVFSLVHLEHVGACGLYRPRLGPKTVVSLIDPGSRRQWRLAKSARSNGAKARHVVASLVFTVVESYLRVSSRHWHVVSESDAGYLAKRYRHRGVIAVPMMSASEPPARRPAGREGLTEVLVPVDLRYDHMVRAVTALGDELRRLGPSVSRGLHITILCRVAAPVGPVEAWAGLPVEFVPWVSDFEAQIARSDVVVLPDVVGTGLKTRTVRALAHGKAVVGTSAAFEGIEVTDGIDALVADTPQVLARSIVRLQSEHELVTRLSGNGRQVGRRLSDNVSTLERWRAIYDSILAGGRSTPGSVRR